MSDKWDIVTDEKGIQLKIREPFLTKEEAINLSEALKRSVGFLDNIQKKKIGDDHDEDRKETDPIASAFGDLRFFFSG